MAVFLENAVMDPNMYVGAEVGVKVGDAVGVKVGDAVG